MKPLLKRLFKPKDPIILVSGLPRSGTSLMMEMLKAGGIQIISDNIRGADDDNPRGYFEFEDVKKLKEGQAGWLGDAGGKAVKAISALLEYLPSEYDYKVVFMRREMEEILASQKKMLINRGEDTKQVDNGEIARIFESHLAKVTGWLDQQSNFNVLYVSYNELLADPNSTSRRLSVFFDNQLDPLSMAAVVDPSLYRQRGTHEDSA